MNNEIEDLLIGEKSIDELIKNKMEQEIKIEQEQKNKKNKEKIVSDIKDVPRSLIFSKDAIYLVFNRKNKTQSFINGIQAESLIGMQKSIYEKIKNAEIDAFSTDNEYVKFEKIKIIDN